MAHQAFKINGNRKGFTLIELMIVIAIIGILTALAAPSFISYRIKGYNASSNTDIRNAFVAAQAYFSDYPDGTITGPNLISYGFRSSSNVTLSIITGTQSGLSLTTAHGAGDKTYSIDADGNVSY